MKTKNKIFILTLVGMLLLPYAILNAQNADEIGQSTLVSISITEENGFVPSKFEAQAGKTITIELTSDDNSVHELKFSDKSLKDLTISVNTDQTTSITFNAPKELKDYSFYCTVPGHKQKGEAGTMIVVKPILTNPVDIDEDITAEDLEIEEPKMLSTNIFYPLKNLWNNVKIALTINPVEKAEMRLDLANEKLIEAKKLTEEFDEPEKAVKAINAYQKEISKSIEIMENITEKNQVQAEILSDKIIDNSFKQQSLINGLEKKLDSKNSNELNNAKEESARYVSVIIDKIIPPEKIESKIIEMIENQRGSEFKDFKNLEILKAIEEKVPEQAKEAIQKAQENTIQRLEKKIETMDEETKEAFNDYVENIGGNEIRHLKVIEDIAKNEIREDVSQTIASIKEKTIDKISNRIEEFSDEKQDNFLDNLKTEKIEDLRVIKELENSVSIQAKDRITEIKKEMLQKISENISTSTDTEEKEKEYLVNISGNNDIKQLEILEEIKNVVPLEQKNIIEKAKIEIIRKIKEDVANAKNEEEKEKILNKIVDYRPEQIKIIEEIDDQGSSIIKDILLQKQTERIESKIQVIENTSTLEQLRERVQIREENGGESSIETKQIQERIENRIEAIEIENIKKEQEVKDITKRPEEFEIDESMQSLSQMKKSTNCIQVITPALNPANNACVNFPTPCDVPSGWKKVENCVQADKMENVNTLTCLELCGSLNYEKGICRSWAVVPSAKMGCRDNETRVNATSDCFVLTNLEGLGRACCCSTSENIIIPSEGGETSTDKPQY